MSQALKERQTLAVEVVGGREVTLLARQAAQVGERAGDAPRVAERAEGRQALVVERAGGLGIALLAGQVPEVPQGHGGPRPVGDRPALLETLLVEGARSRKLSLGLDHAGQVARRARHGHRVAELAPQVEALFEESA